MAAEREPADQREGHHHGEKDPGRGPIQGAGRQEYGVERYERAAPLGRLGLPSDVADAELERLTRAGVRGARFHLLPGGMLTFDALEPMAERIAAFGWHIQLQLDGRELPHHAATLGRLPVPLVIDHNGKFLEPVSTEHPGFKSLLRLIAGGNTWVKLSAPYETSRTGPPRYADVGVLAKALSHAYPERCVWASNWPHPGRNPVPDTADMLDLLLEWADDDATRRRILVDNPAELYGF